MEDNEIQNIFIEGAISVGLLSDTLKKFEKQTEVGAHNLFMGQVRADILNGKKIAAIEYTGYQPMVLQKMQQIRTQAFQKFSITGLTVFHSLGIVEVGGICLAVFASSPRRRVVFEALEYVVEEIKKELPIFGKELFEDDSYQWKKNT